MVVHRAAERQAGALHAQGANEALPDGAAAWPFTRVMRLPGGRLMALFWEVLADYVPPMPGFASFKAGKFGIERVHRPVDDPIRRLSGDYGYRQWTPGSQDPARLNSSRARSTSSKRKWPQRPPFGHLQLRK